MGGDDHRRARLGGFDGETSKERCPSESAGAAARSAAHSVARAATHCKTARRLSASMSLSSEDSRWRAGVARASMTAASSSGGAGACAAAEQSSKHPATIDARVEADVEASTTVSRARNRFLPRLRTVQSLGEHLIPVGQRASHRRVVVHVDVRRRGVRKFQRLAWRISLLTSSLMMNPGLNNAARCVPSPCTNRLPPTLRSQRVKTPACNAGSTSGTSCVT